MKFRALIKAFMRYAKGLFTAFLIFYVSGSLWAGKLDVDYIRPSPTKAFMYSLFIPGGGYFYLSEQSIAIKRTKLQCLKFFVLGAAGYYFTAHNLYKGHPGAALASAGAVLTLKLWEFDSVIGTAEKARWINFKEYNSGQDKASEEKDGGGKPKEKLR